MNLVASQTSPCVQIAKRLGPRSGLTAEPAENAPLELFIKKFSQHPPNIAVPLMGIPPSGYARGGARNQATNKTLSQIPGLRNLKVTAFRASLSHWAI